MFKKILFLLTIVTVVNVVNAQVKPINGSTVNYRLVGFSVPENKKASSYILEIAEGTINNEIDFQKKKTITQTADTNKIVETVPYFGKPYTWRIIAKDSKGKNIGKSTLYHFSTAYSKYIDSLKYRLRIINHAEQHGDMLVFLDHSPVMYDMNGNPLWFLPDMPGLLERDRRIRDLKPTADGTFTIMSDLGAFELDYDGRILWKAPDDGKVSGDSVERYHHELTKLSNGNYMVAGYQKIWLPVPPKFDINKIPVDETVKKEGGKLLKRIDCGTLIEYDKKGNVVWSWKTADHFRDEDFFSNILPDSTPNTNTHLNSFFFDETKQYIYIGYRDISRIVKIKYPSGGVIRSYGKPVERQTAGMRKFLFRAQHSCQINKDGNMFMFNNNTARSRDVISELNIFKEPANTSEGLTKIWEFPCNIDTFAAPGSASGGSVGILSDSCVLACMGIEGRVFLVSYNKELIWNAIPQYKNDYNVWEILPQYRANFIENRENIKKYIFSKR